MELFIFENRRDGAFIISPSGWIDGTNIKLLEDKLKALVNCNEKKLVVNLEYTANMGTEVWMVLRDFVAVLRAIGGDMKLAAMNEEVGLVYELLDAHEFIKSYRNAEEAVESFVTN